MGVAAVETINVEEDTDHDEDIARGVALEEHMSGQEPPASKSVTASTSSTSSSTASASSKMKLNIHLQDTTQKFCATAASRRRDQVTNEMLNLIKDANKQANEEDDELDLSFASMAKRMRKNLNEKQHEKVLSGIQKLVSSAIENAEAGLPVIPPPPNMLQPIPVRTPTPPNFGGTGPSGPTATPVPHPTGAPGDYFQPGPPSLSFLPTF